MTRYAFLTDIHLDCLSPERLESFLRSLTDQSKDVDGFLLSGDISTAPLLEKHLRLLLTACEKSIFFCLGNHDFWYGSIENVRRNAHVMSRESNLDWPCLYYVNSYQYIPLTPKTAVVGHDGWYDGLYGDWCNSSFLMNDWFNIKEFNDLRTTFHSPRFGSRLTMLEKGKIVDYCRQLANEAADHIERNVQRAIADGYENVIVVTHVPPWQEVHVHEGKPGGNEAAPWFTSKIMGEMLEGVAKRYPDVQFTVLCGHTHGATSVQISDNLTCKVGGADYINPQVQFVLEIE